MNESSERKPPSALGSKQLAAWPLGCALAVFNLLLLFTLVGMLGVIAASARLPPWLALTMPLIGVAPVPLAELFGSFWLRRRNPYAARTLAWGLALTVIFTGLLFIITETINRASGL